MEKYVLAFIFDSNKENVLLIRKNRPEFLKGKLNGIGGKIEEGESELEAIKREVEEESGLVIEESTFKPLGLIQNSHNEEEDQFVVNVFFAKGNVFEAQTLTDEEVSVFNTKEAIERNDLNEQVKEILLTSLKDPQF